MGLLSHSSQSASEEEQLPVAPLTSGNWSLDQALETHLDICSILLEVETHHTITPEPLRSTPGCDMQPLLHIGTLILVEIIAI